ncbi:MULTISPECIES: enoyl-ACP reductase FabI [Holospora]|uniref:Enoyl-[acyl-carrier-protein] reductase [NADH] n=2 Tax=Holospora TaxID=44747 RepID=A0A061JGR4_9PROT|nr:MULTISPECIES: SDR family oxidoreductase [Holospora]ETZ05260.1 enoyl-[acyl-carrier-protein] reductase [NADH] 1 [Holospora undulata HU1]GAJ46154.1 enoyl-[acyl-carrier-protein] reductase [NADH] 1 [Holospora elegans E1]
MLLKGKKGLILGVANQDSISWGVAKKVAESGAELVITYQTDTLKRRVEPLAKTLDSAASIFPCDVEDSNQIFDLFQHIRKTWGKLDFMLHGAAYSDKQELKGKFLDTSKQNFIRTMHISCFSLIEMTKEAASLMTSGGSIVTLSYYGAEKVIPHYNVMGVAKAALESSVRYLAADLGPQGIRVNAISAGPMRTLAAAGGIDGFRYILDWTTHNAPLRAGVTQEDVGDVALYLFSGMSSKVTGEVHHVDSGYHVIGMKLVHAPDIQKNV